MTGIDQFPAAVRAITTAAERGHARRLLADLPRDEAERCLDDALGLALATDAGFLEALFFMALRGMNSGNTSPGYMAEALLAERRAEARYLERQREQQREQGGRKH